MLSRGGVLPDGVIRAAPVERAEGGYGLVDDGGDVDAGDGHRQEAHGGQHAVAPAHVTGDGETLPALGVGHGAQHAAGDVRRREDVALGGGAVFLFQHGAEHAEGDRGLQRRTGLGDDVDVEVVVPKLLDDAVEVVRAQAVADEEDLRIVLAGQGAQQLDGPAGAEVGAADADDHQGLGAGTYLRRRGEDGLELALFHAHGQLRPAGELRARAALFLKQAVGRGGGGIVRAGGVKKRSGAAEVNFYHVPHPFV